MGLIVKPKTFVDNETLLFTDLNSLMDTIYNKFNGSIGNSNIDGSAAIAPTKISGTAVTLDGTETLTNKTLTSPTINTPTINSPTIGTSVILPNSTGVTTDGAMVFDGTNEDLAIGDGTAAQKIHMGAWKTWTPTISGLTVGNGTLAAKYAVIGKSVLFNIHFTFGSSSSLASTPVISLPVNQKDTQYQGSGTFLDANTGIYYTSQVNIGNNNVYIYAIATASTFASSTGPSATAPFTWTTGDQIVITAFYEAA